MSGSPTRRPPTSLPGPRALPVLGNIPSLLRGRIHEAIERLVLRHGDVWRLRVPPISYAVVSDPDALRRIFVDDFEKTRRSRILEMAEPLFGEHSFFMAEGERWRERRGFFDRTFRSDHLQQLVDVANARCEILLEKLDRSCDGRTPVDLKPACQRLALDINGFFSFGYAIDSQLGDGRYDHCLEDYWAHASNRFLAPVPYWKLLHTRGVRRFDVALERLEALVRSATATRRRQPLGKGLDPLSLMLRANRETPGAFSDAEVRDQLFTFLNGGTDTNASTFSWLFYALCREPRVQARAAAEADGCFAVAHRPRYEDVKRLSWAEAVVRETMRLFPAVTAIYRGLCEEIDVLGYAIPADWELWIPVYAIHRHPRLWSRPHAFEPERWLRRGAPLHPYQFLNFAAGPRSCPGRQAALLTAKLLLARACQRFRFRLAPGAVVRPDNGVIMQVDEQLPVIVEKR